MVAVKPRPLTPGRHLYSMPVDLATRAENATLAQFLPFAAEGDRVEWGNGRTAFSATVERRDGALHWLGADGRACDATRVTFPSGGLVYHRTAAVTNTVSLAQFVVEVVDRTSVPGRSSKDLAPLMPVGYLNTPTGTVQFEILDMP